MLVMDNKIITTVLIVYDVSMAAAALSSVYFPLSLPKASARPLALRSMMFLRSLSIFSLTMTTLLGWIPTLTVAPLALPLNPLDVDSELLPVALDNLAHLLTLVVTSHHPM